VCWEAEILFRISIALHLCAISTKSDKYYSIYMTGLKHRNNDTSLLFRYTHLFTWLFRTHIYSRGCLVQTFIHVDVWYTFIHVAMDPFPIQPWQRPVTIWVYKPEASNTVKSSWWWAVCRSKHVEPSKNFGIINSIIKPHLVGFSTEYTYIFCFVLKVTGSHNKEINWDSRKLHHQFMTDK
jgi:hypothetical protein